MPVLLAGVAYAAAVVLGVADLRDWDPSLGPSSWTLNVVTTLAFMTVIFLGEEIGWRGYLLPRVQQLTSRRRAALVTGFVHGCFHLPLILIATTYDEFGSRWFVAPDGGGVPDHWVVSSTPTSGTAPTASGPVSMAHGSINLAFTWGPQRVVGSQTDLAYVAGESGVATFAVVALLAVAVPGPGEGVAGPRGRLSCC